MGLVGDAGTRARTAAQSGARSNRCYPRHAIDPFPRGEPPGPPPVLLGARSTSRSGVRIAECGGTKVPRQYHYVPMARDCNAIATSARFEIKEPARKGYCAARSLLDQLH